MIKKEYMPEPYIQNRNSWCWAVACRIIGEQYKKLHPQWKFSILKEKKEDNKIGMVSLEEYEKGVLTEEWKGLRIEAAGKRNGCFTVDSWQRAIVANANTAIGIGYEGDIGGDDEAKMRGIKYVIAGDIFCETIKIENLGYYQERENIFDKYREKIMETLKKKNIF